MKPVAMLEWDRPLSYIVSRKREEGMSEDIQIRRKRLRYRSWHRGTKELDLLLGKFAEQHLGDLSDGQLDAYEAILESDEHDIYSWISGRAPVPDEHDNEVMAAILSFRLTDGNL
jgi:antitoxin CptB